MKRVWSFLLVLAVLCSFSPVFAQEEAPVEEPTGEPAAEVTAEEILDGENETPVTNSVLEETTAEATGEPDSVDTIYSGQCGENATWSLNMTTGVLAISGTGAMYDYGYYADAKGGMHWRDQPWKKYAESVTGIVVESGITAVGGQAFSELDSVTGVSLSDTVTEIGTQAFYLDYGLAAVVLPAGLTVIGDEAFCSDPLTEIVLPDSLVSIGADAFKGTSIGAVVIPASVRSIGEGAFAVRTMTEITVSVGNVAYTSVDGVLFSKNMKTIVQYPAGKTQTTYTIPDGVSVIADRAFYLSSKLREIVISDSVIKIGSDAFAWCKGLAEVYIPESVETIQSSSTGIGPFRSCSSALVIYCAASEAQPGWEENWNCILGSGGLTELQVVYNCDFHQPEPVSISTENVARTSSGVSGSGTVHGDYTEGDLIRIAVVYENAAGVQILVINSAEIRADSTFKIPNVKAAYGYTLQSVCLVVVNDDAAMDGAYGPYAVSDQIIL